MKFALFLGCRIPSQVPAYEASTRAVLAHFGIEVVDLPFTCCGYPARSASRDGFALSAARNLALAERAGLDLLTPCQCCFGTLRHAQRFLDEDAGLSARAAHALAAEGLAWSGRTEVRHLLQVLAREVGVATLAAAVRRPQAGLSVAAQYGCHALRPSNVTAFDNPLAPTLFEALVAATGATPVDWPRRLECCGDPLHENNTALAARMTRAKIVDAVESGASVMCTACPHCQLRFEAARSDPRTPAVRTLLYPQLLGLALGLPEAALGL